MHTTDALGRRRHPAQHRGLRPLFPKLPQACSSRLIRVAMSDDAWERLDSLVASAATTKPRALGELFERLLATAATPQRAQATSSIRMRQPATRVQPQGEGFDWQDWQTQKELALLAAARRGADGPALLSWRN